MQTMEELIKECGDKYLKNINNKDNKDIYKLNDSKSYKYLCLIIELCIDKNTEDRYFTIFNEQNKFHVHSTNKKEVKLICRCFKDIKNGKNIDKYKLIIRDKALKLCGFNVRYKK